MRLNKQQHQEKLRLCTVYTNIGCCVCVCVPGDGVCGGPCLGCVAGAQSGPGTPIHVCGFPLCGPHHILSLSPCVNAAVSACLSLSLLGVVGLSVLLSLKMCLCISMGVCVCVSMPVPVPVPVYFHGCVCVCVCVCACACACPFPWV